MLQKDTAESRCSRKRYAQFLYVIYKGLVRTALSNQNEVYLHNDMSYRLPLDDGQLDLCARRRREVNKDCGQTY